MSVRRAAATLALVAPLCAPATVTAASRGAAAGPGRRGAATGTVVADRAPVASVAAAGASHRAAAVEPTATPIRVLPTVTGHPVYVRRRARLARAGRGTVSRRQVSAAVMPRVVAARLVRGRTVALTFDDGPDPAWTPKVLALLHRYRAPAVFCLIGENAAAYPHLVKAIAAAGDPTCDHTWDHDERLATRPLADIRAEIGRARRAIVAAGSAPVFFRAPGGDWSPLVDTEARSQHLVPLRWTVDPRDWSRPGTRAIIAAVLAQLRPGGVILLHDGGGDRSQTLAALAVLLRTLPARGYSFVLPPPQ